MRDCPTFSNSAHYQFLSDSTLVAHSCSSASCLSGLGCQLLVVSCLVGYDRAYTILSNATKGYVTAPICFCSLLLTQWGDVKLHGCYMSVGKGYKKSPTKRFKSFAGTADGKSQMIGLCLSNTFQIY